MTLMLAENDNLHGAFATRVIAEIWHKPVEIIQVDDGGKAIEVARQQDIRYAVLDLQLPSASGIEVARVLWTKCPEIQIVFWSNYTDEAYLRTLERIVPPDARYGFVLKSASEEMMKAALESVFFRDRKAIDKEIRQVQHRVTNQLESLSDVEYEGLIDIALGLTDQAIANRRKLSVRGVQNRLRHLYEKLEVDTASLEGRPSNAYNSRTRAITFALQRGLINFELLRSEQAKLDRWLANSRTAMRARPN